MRLRLGTHPNNTSLHIFGTRHDLHAELADRGLELDVFHYNTGSMSIPLLQAGAIDIAGTGSTPPLNALAAGMDVVMIAMTNSRSDAGGILVRADSDLHTPADLAGASIAMMPTSWHPPYVAEVLGRAGIGWNDARPVFLNTPTAQDALRDGRIDAYVATGPEYHAFQETLDLRILAPVKPYHSNRSVIWAQRSAVAGAGERLLDLLESISTSDRGVAADPDAAATLLAGGPAPALARTLSARRPGWMPVDAEFIDEQQHHADLLLEAGLISTPVDAHGAVLDLSPAPSTPAS